VQDRKANPGFVNGPFRNAACSVTRPPCSATLGAFGELGRDRAVERTSARGEDAATGKHDDNTGALALELRQDADQAARLERPPEDEQDIGKLPRSA
jgi:hypothetical protein